MPGLVKVNRCAEKSVKPVPDGDIAVDAIQIPRHWARINGIDFGWDHPFAADGTNLVPLRKSERAGFLVDVAG